MLRTSGSPMMGRKKYPRTDRREIPQKIPSKTDIYVHREIGGKNIPRLSGKGSIKNPGPKKEEKYPKTDRKKKFPGTTGNIRIREHRPVEKEKEVRSWKDRDSNTK